MAENLTDKSLPNVRTEVAIPPTEESWSPHYPKTIHDMFPTPSSRYGWSQMGPIAEAGGISKLAGGGLTRTVAPDSGPVSRGLSYLYNRVRRK